MTAGISFEVRGWSFVRGGEPRVEGGSCSAQFFVVLSCGWGMERGCGQRDVVTLVCAENREAASLLDGMKGFLFDCSYGL